MIIWYHNIFESNDKRKVVHSMYAPLSVLSSSDVGCARHQTGTQDDNSDFLSALRCTLSSIAACHWLVNHKDVESCLPNTVWPGARVCARAPFIVFTVVCHHGQSCSECTSGPVRIASSHILILHSYKLRSNWNLINICLYLIFIMAKP